MMNYVLSIDQGTTGTFVGLMDQDGIMVRSGYKVHRQIDPQPGWIEQDPEELWQNARELINKVIELSAIKIGQIVGIGIANQGESILMWDGETGRPVYNVLVWQDTRTQAFVDGLAVNEQVALEVSKSTGLKLDSYFSASKIHWLLDTIAETSALLRAGRLMCGTLDTWLIWKMTQGRAFVTDVSTASRTLLFNIHTLAWDPWLLELFEVPPKILPEVLPSCAEFGVVSQVLSVRSVSWLNDETTT